MFMNVFSNFILASIPEEKIIHLFYTLLYVLWNQNNNEEQ